MTMDKCYDMVEQILFDVLLYLPVMSLLRFKAVCKYWFSLIESSDFISRHLNLNRDSEEDNFIILCSVMGQTTREAKFALVCGSEYEQCVYDICIGQVWHSATAGNIFLPCYCDGIVCLKRGNEIALWNPALKQSRAIPPPLLSDRLCADISVMLKEKRSTFSYVSFGFDVKSNDYKLVAIMLEYPEYTDMGMINNQVEVYNLGGDNSWRIIHKNDALPFFEIHTFYSISSGKSGKCFWKAYRYDGTDILLSFDFSDDVFRTMLLPVRDVRTGLFDLDFLDDKVVYVMEPVMEPVTEGHKVFEIWMLHEFGVEESWNIIYKVGPFMYMDTFYSRRMSKNGEFLICSRNDSFGRYMLYLYNLHTQQGNFLQDCNLDISSSGEIIHYNASLLSLKSANIVRPTD